MVRQPTKKLSEKEPHHEWIVAIHKSENGEIPLGAFECKWCGMPRAEHRHECCSYLKPFYDNQSLVVGGPDFRKICTEGLPVRCGVTNSCKVCLGRPETYGVAAVNTHYSRNRAEIAER